MLLLLSPSDDDVFVAVLIFELYDPVRKDDLFGASSVFDVDESLMSRTKYT
jgi:hypothetical protein